MAMVIKGNLPDSCGFCWECLGGGSGAYYCNRTKRHISDVVPPYDRRMEWCPILGEIPDKHGDLIEADKLAEQYMRYLMLCFPAMQVSTANELVNAVKEAVKIAPVVVEATT